MYYLCYLCFTLILIEWTYAEDPRQRVYGGETSQPGYHKHLVYLETQLHESYTVECCSGSILNNRWIISAAHCFENENISNVEVRKYYSKLPQKIIANVDRSCITVHPGYIQEGQYPATLEKDLALLKTTKKILFDDFTKPISLASTKPKFGIQALMAGYGESEKTRVNVIPRYGTALLVKCPGHDNELLCTYTTVRAGPGDSGGALVHKGKLIGVITASCVEVKVHKDCHTYYVDVYQHLSWIKKVTGIV